MAGIEIIWEGEVGVDFGKSGDPDRIAKIMANIRYSFGGDSIPPDAFVPHPSDHAWRSRKGLAAWPEGLVKRPVAIGKLDIPVVENYEELKQLVEESGYEHLLFPFLTCELPWLEFEQSGLQYVTATDPNSLLHSEKGLLVPCRFCRSSRATIVARSVGKLWCSDTGIILGRK